MELLLIDLQRMETLEEHRYISLSISISLFFISIFNNIFKTWEGYLDKMVDQANRLNRKASIPSASGQKKVSSSNGNLARNKTTMFAGSVSQTSTPRGSLSHFFVGTSRRPPVMRPLKEGVVDDANDGPTDNPSETVDAELIKRVRAWLDDLPADLERPVTPVIIEDEPRPLEATFTFVHGDNR